MSVTATALPGVLIVDPPVFSDERGWLTESYNLAQFDEWIGQEQRFVQDNHSLSAEGVLRGLHYQVGRPQGKLVRCTRGAVFDVAVDLRRQSPTFAGWYGIELSAENRSQLWIPVGFGHGFLVLDGPAEVQYKTTDYYYPEGDRAVRWDDPAFGIDWPLTGSPRLSEKDANAPYLEGADLFDMEEL